MAIFHVMRALFFVFCFFKMWTFYLVHSCFIWSITNYIAPEKRARAFWSEYFVLGSPLHFKMGGEVELRHLSDCEPIKQRPSVWVGPWIPRGPEDVYCGGAASGARLLQPGILFQTLGSQRCHWNANPVLTAGPIGEASCAITWWRARSERGPSGSAPAAW